MRKKEIFEGVRWMKNPCNRCCARLCVVAAILIILPRLFLLFVKSSTLLIELISSPLG